MVNIVSRYFSWLRNNAPMGQVETYPIVSEQYETNIPGIYIIGDLTGIPLLKLAADSGHKVWNFIPRLKNDLLDAVIIGAGPSGVSCALEALRQNRCVVVLESNSAFQTIVSFPKGKPIFAEPKSFQSDAAIQIKDGTKESLLNDLKTELIKTKIPLFENERVTDVFRNSSGKGFLVKTESGKEFRSNFLIVAMGKSGDPRRLEVKGENLPHVSYRLLDPADYQDKELLIVGGGDSALEAAISTSKFSKKVTLVYRGEDFSRPKEENRSQFNELVKLGGVTYLKNTTVSEIGLTSVFLKSGNVAKKISLDHILVLIGNKPPIPFLERLEIQIENSRSFRQWLGFGSMLFFAMTVYFGKASFYGPSWFSGLTSVSAICFLGTSLTWLGLWMKDFGFRLPQGWPLFRNTYLTLASLYFLFVYFGASYGGIILFGKFPSFHYTFLYSLTILIFGIRRIYVKPTAYIKLQTRTLIFVQWFFLFLLPEIILPFLGSQDLLGPADGFLLTQVFPNKAYWKAYGFILAWPLSMGVLYDGAITYFWLAYGLIFTFGFIPFLVYRYGKGAYCGWICSCGGLAETLGDEHRKKMPHGKWAYALEHSGQWILLLAFILTLLKLGGVFGKRLLPELSILEMTADSVKWLYDLVVDIGLAGVVGVGCYFFLSGRIWCRMFCPLASLMHIYAKFSKFRIFSEKKKCISCNICTKVCHQGIDVMSYANRGIPMDSVQCVRCSACVSMCPTDVLSFGQLKDGIITKDTISAVL